MKELRKLRIDVIVFLILITALGAANLLNFNKPAISNLEKRVLKSKPEFSLSGLFKDNYFHDFEEYYSDTFILRDNLVKANRDIRHAMEFLGPDVSLITVYEDIKPPGNGAANQKDAATGTTPRDETGKATGEETEEPSGETQLVETSTGKTPAGETPSEAKNMPGAVSEESTPGTGESKEIPSQDVEEPRDFGDGQNVGYWLVVDGQAVQLFKFKKESFDYYAEVLNKFNEKLGDKVKIYSMIPPTASEFLELKKYKGITDSQNDALAYLKSKLNKNIISVNVYDALNEHKDEYIYFRTDHHWTALGAYYAYAAFMETTGIQPVSLDRYEAIDMGDYLGSSYTKTLDKSLEENPDKFIAYKPFTNHEFIVRYENEERRDDVIDMKYSNDVTNKYLSFISAGGGIWGVIKTDADNGKKIMVVKDSFGNALVPFLLPHYEEIYVVDPRFYSRYVTGQNIVEFVEDKGITEIAFVIYMEDVNWHDFMSWTESLLGN